MMKKIILLFLGIILLTGCNSKEEELCNRVTAIDLDAYKEKGNYDELSSLLQEKYDIYCTDSTTDVCSKLKEYIEAASNTTLNTLDKNIFVDYRSEEFWAICHDKYN